MGEAKTDRGRREKTEPLDRALTERKEDTERKILDLLEEESEWEKRANTERQR